MTTLDLKAHRLSNHIRHLRKNVDNRATPYVGNIYWHFTQMLTASKWMSGCMENRCVRWMDEQVDGWVDGWMNGGGREGRIKKLYRKYTNPKLYLIFA